MKLIGKGYEMTIRVEEGYAVRGKSSCPGGGIRGDPEPAPFPGSKTLPYTPPCPRLPSHNSVVCGESQGEIETAQFCSDYIVT